jgi:hypothetical protein
VKEKAAQKTFFTIPLSGWVCHITGKVGKSINSVLVIRSDFTRDEDNLACFAGLFPSSYLATYRLS